MEYEPLQPFRRVREILRNVLSLHVRSIAQYETALPCGQDPRQSALLSYLCDSEKLLAAAVGRYEQTDDEVLETIIQGVPCELSLSAASEGTGEGGIDRLLADYRVRNAAMLLFYEQLEASVGPRAQAIFVDLADLSRRNVERLNYALLDL